MDYHSGYLYLFNRLTDLHKVAKQLEKDIQAAQIQAEELCAGTEECKPVIFSAKKSGKNTQ